MARGERSWPPADGSGRGRLRGRSQDQGSRRHCQYQGSHRRSRGKDLLYVMLLLWLAERGYGMQLCLVLGVLSRLMHACMSRNAEWLTRKVINTGRAHDGSPGTGHGSWPFFEPTVVLYPDRSASFPECSACSWVNSMLHRTPHLRQCHPKPILRVPGHRRGLA